MSSNMNWDLTPEVRRLVHIPVCLVGIVGTLWSRFDLVDSSCANHLHSGTVHLLTDYNAASIAALTFFTLTLTAYMAVDSNTLNPALVELDLWLGGDRSAMDKFAGVVNMAVRAGLFLFSWIYYFKKSSGATIHSVMDAPAHSAECGGGILSPYTAFMFSVVCLGLVVLYEFACLVMMFGRWQSGQERKLDGINIGTEYGIQLSGFKNSLSNLIEAGLEGFLALGFLLSAGCAFVLAWASLDDKHFCSPRITEHAQLVLVLSLAVASKLWVTATEDATQRKPTRTAMDKVNTLLFRVMVALFFIIQFALYNERDGNCVLPTFAKFPVAATPVTSPAADDTLKYTIDIGTYSIAVAAALYMIYMAVALYLLYQGATSIESSVDLRNNSTRDAMPSGQNHPRGDMSNTRLISNSKKVSEVELNFV